MGQYTSSIVRVFTVFEELAVPVVLEVVEAELEDEVVTPRDVLEEVRAEEDWTEDIELEEDGEEEVLTAVEVEGRVVVVDCIEDARSAYPPAAAAITITTITTTTATVLLIACLALIFMSETRINVERCFDCYLSNSMMRGII